MSRLMVSSWLKKKKWKCQSNEKAVYRMGKCIPGKGLIFKIYIQLKHLIIKKPNNTIRAWFIQLNSKPSKDHKWIIKCFLKCSTSLATREIKKTTLRFTITPSEWLLINKTDEGDDVGKGEHFFIVDASVIWYNHYGNQYGSSSKR